jgi:hypothetical protein
VASLAVNVPRLRDSVCGNGSAHETAPPPRFPFRLLGFPRRFLTESRPPPSRQEPCSREPNSTDSQPGSARLPLTWTKKVFLEKSPPPAPPTNPKFQEFPIEKTGRRGFRLFGFSRHRLTESRPRLLAKSPAQQSKPNSTDSQPSQREQLEGRAWHLLGEERRPRPLLSPAQPSEPTSTHFLPRSREIHWKAGLPLVWVKRSPLMKPAPAFSHKPAQGDDQTLRRRYRAKFQGN